MTEISPKDLVYLEMATVAANLGDASASNEGALLVDHDGRVKGLGHFRKIVDLSNEDLIEEGATGWLDPIETLLLTTSPQDQKDGTVYIYGRPGKNQATRLIASGIRRVVCRSDTDWHKDGLQIMVAKGIQVDEVTGDLNQKNKEMIVSRQHASE